jgi:hypothetical protein
MDLVDQEAATTIFVAACEKNQATIDAMPIDSVEREAYAEGLSDGVHFVLEAFVAN